MKHLILVFFLLCSAFCWAAPVPDDYNLNVHVSSTRMMRDTQSPGRYQSLVVTIDGKKYELESIDSPNALLMPGDYKARLVKDQHWTGRYDSYRVYEFFFSDSKKREYVVVGQSE